MSIGLLFLGILPAALLMRYIYKKDRIDKEPKGLLIKLFVFGALSTISAVALEYIGEDFFDDYYYTDSIAYQAILAFIVVAFAEELGKFVVVKLVAWKHSAFNTTFDAIVYAVFASLGFATLENILYLFDGSYSTAFWRGILSVPGHAIDAVFMGNYLGIAKRCEALGDEKGKKANLWKALIMPILTHGFYDFCLFVQTPLSFLTFFVYEIAITIYTIKKVNKLSREDTLLFPGGFYPGHFAAQQLYMQGAIPGYQPMGFQPGMNNFDPMTGRPIVQPRPQTTFNFDPNTGRPIAQPRPRTVYNFDPNTGRPIAQQRPQTTYNFDPNTGRPIAQPRPRTVYNFDPNTGRPITQQQPQITYNFDPNNGKPYAQQSSVRRFDPETGQPIINSENYF